MLYLHCKYQWLFCLYQHRVGEGLCSSRYINIFLLFGRSRTPPLRTFALKTNFEIINGISLKPVGFCGNLVCACLYKFYSNFRQFRRERPRHGKPFGSPRFLQNHSFTLSAAVPLFHKTCWVLRKPYFLFFFYAFFSEQNIGCSLRVLNTIMSNNCAKRKQSVMQTKRPRSGKAARLL